MSATTHAPQAHAAGDQAETTDLSKQYDTPLGLAHTTMQALKDRIKLHYDLASDYYLNLWGEHIHHGYWPTDASKASESKETAQLNLIRLLLSISDLPMPNESSSTPNPLSNPSPKPLRILDVGCGVGGTTRFLASTLGASVTGITISSKQVQIATRLSRQAASSSSSATGDGRGAEQLPGGDGGDDAGSADGAFIPIGPNNGRVRFMELDAEKMGEFFSSSSSSASSSASATTTTAAGTVVSVNGDQGQGQSAGDGEFDVIWISEALSHFPNKALFFRNVHKLLRPGGKGKLVLADWFKAESLAEGVFEADIKPIEDGMLLPPLCTQQEYVRLATGAGLQVFGGPKDISKDVSKTWDISWSLVQNPSLWAFAFSQGRDGIAFLQAFRAMRRGYANGSFRYAVMAFVKQ